MNHALSQEPEPEERLSLLALLWDELAGGHNCKRFEQEFRPDLEHLGRFRSDFPMISPVGLINLLEQKVIAAFRERFPRNGILALRAQLSCSN